MNTRKNPGQSTAPKSRTDSAKAPRGLSMVAAALAVLAASKEPMNTKSIVAAAKERGLWTPGKGRTPEQTLYSAFTREIKTKGSASRVRLADRGRFEPNRS